MIVMDIKRAVASGKICSSLFVDVDEWVTKMSKNGVFVDHLWMEMTAQILDCDVVIVTLHRLPSGPCHIKPAGLLANSGVGDVYHGKNLPIFIGN